ncbi:MAG: Ldh family oxidoreductase [Pseudomonadota bacterium]
MVEVSLDKIEDLTRAALMTHGARDDVASHVAQAVRVAEAKGNKICGLYYLESYCKQLQTGRVDGQAEPSVHKPRDASVLVDAKFGFAQAAFAAGLETALNTARDMGTCSFAVAHAHTCTSLGYFTEQIARSGFIALGFTNASAIVAPPGGNKRIIGTNPMAMAVPGPDGIAFQFDYSTSAVALGKITMAKAAGEAIPLGWAVDANGADTTDPDAALKGALKSAGDYKGWGHGLMVEVLAAAFTGSIASTDVSPLKASEGPPHNLGQTYLILDPTLHNPNFHNQISALKAAVDAQDGARLPGTRFDMPDAVDLPDAQWDELQRLAKGPA